MRIKRVIIDKANRLYQLPPKLMDEIQAESGAPFFRKQSLIDLASVTWPVTMESSSSVTPADLSQATSAELSALKEEIAAWFTKRLGVNLHADKEIFVGADIPSLTRTLCMAFLDRGEVAFVPQLAAPYLRRSIILVGGEPVNYALSPKEDWQPDFSVIETRVGSAARFLFLNSPHDPTGAVLSERTLHELLVTASKKNIAVINDASYQSLIEPSAPSLMTIQDSEKVGIELYSVSSLLGIADIGLGIAVGNRSLISGLKSLSEYHPHPTRLQISLMKNGLGSNVSLSLKSVRKQIQQTHAAALAFLQTMGWENAGVGQMPFLWAKLAKQRQALAMARLLFRRSRVLVAPGGAFGENGHAFVRLSLTAGSKPYQEATERVKKRVASLGAREDE